MTLILRLLINAAALWVATRFITGIRGDGELYGLIAVALVFGLVNAIIRPVVKLFTFPFFILTLGLFTFVINAAMLMLTSFVAVRLGFSFTVAGFAPALWASLLISIVSGLLSFILIDDDDDDDE
jgi:putative membrane protein